MKTVYKYSLRVTDSQVITLPKGSKILSVGEQHGNIRLWALVDTTEPEAEQHTIIVHGTGHNANDVEGATFIGTVFLADGSLVFHVFEKQEGGVR